MTIYHKHLSVLACELQQAGLEDPDSLNIKFHKLSKGKKIPEMELPDLMAEALSSISPKWRQHADCMIVVNCANLQGKIRIEKVLLEISKRVESETFSIHVTRFCMYIDYNLGSEDLSHSKTFYLSPDRKFYSYNELWEIIAELASYGYDDEQE